MGLMNSDRLYPIFSSPHEDKMFGGHSGDGLMVGVEDLSGLSQPS